MNFSDIFSGRFVIIITESHYFACASTDLFFLQENKQNMDKVVEIMYKFKRLDLEELNKLNNEMISNFKKIYNPLCFIRVIKN